MLRYAEEQGADGYVYEPHRTIVRGEEAAKS